MKNISIGKDAAIAMASTHWWEGKSHREIAEIQMFLTELACPWAIFHEAVTKALGRDVYTHEFGLDYEGLCRELIGERDAPTFEQIVNLIPEDKRILVEIK